MNQFKARRWAGLALLLSIFGGCSICPSPYDYDYGAYGTKTPRSDMRHGRVGSLFSDPRYVGSEQGGSPHNSGSVHYGEYGLNGEVIYEDSMDSQGVIIDEVITEGPSLSPGQIIIQ